MKEYVLSVPATYVLYISIVILVPIFINIGEKKKSKKWWILSWLILTVIAGFRNKTGQDWGLYENAYSNLVYHGGNFLKGLFNIETSFKLFSWISYRILGNSLLLFLLYACLTNFFALAAIYRFKDLLNPAWAAFVYTGMLYFIQYNLGRQFLAMMIIFFSIKEITDRHFVRFLIYICFASLFHSTAILVLPLYFYGISIRKNTKYTKWFNILFYILPMVALLCLYPLTFLAQKILGNYKYTSYTISVNVQFGWGAILQIIMLLLVIACYRKQKCGLANNIALLNVSMRIYVLACVFFFLQYIMSNFGGRIYLYFIPCEIFLMGGSLGSIKVIIQSGKVKADLYQLLLLAVIILIIIHGILTSSQGHVPYGFRYFY